MFEDLKANITLLEKKGDAITTEDLLDSMCRLFDGAKRPGLAVDDVEKYGFALVNLFDRLIISYRQEADKLVRLNDEDVNEVVSASKKVFADLSAIRPELERRQEEEQRASKELEEANARITELEAQSKENKRQQADAEEREALLKREIEGFNAWKKAYDTRIESVEETATEATEALKAMKNAWGALKQREELPALVESFDGLQGMDVEIHSFSDLEAWFENTGNGLMSAIAIYMDMLNKVKGVFGER